MIFLLVLLGNTVIPSFLGTYDHSIVPIFLTVFLLFFGISKISILGGLFLAIVGEAFSGLPVGRLAIPFLVVSIIYMLCMRLIHLKPLALPEGGGVNTVITYLAGILLIITFQLSALIVNSVFSFQDFHGFSTILNIHTLLTTVGVSLVMFAVFHISFPKRFNR